jgi:uncharacterized protein YbbC (DUF1343 family)
MGYPVVQTGLDRLVAERFAPLRGRRVGLVAHPASVDARLRHASALLTAADGVDLAAVFGPEHGLLGEAQDLIGVRDGDDPLSGLRCYSLYGDNSASLKPTPAMLSDLGVLVIDLQDVGSRYYTFQATMLYCLEAAAGVRLQVMVLDRPNPLGGQVVEGPTIRPGFESFLGPHPIATRHGLTIGELARLYKTERYIDVDLEVVGCQGWNRSMDFVRTGLPWVLPSPNMPTPDTAFVYPGQCLIEGTNLSEGRGTTRPFELCGAPGVDAVKLCRGLNDQGLSGVVFRPAWFEPTFQKHAGQRAAGFQMHVTDRHSFAPVRTSLPVLAAFRDALGQHFRWRTEEYEFVRDKPAIDILYGSDRERRGLEAGADWREMAAAWESEETEFRERRRPHLLY